MGEYPAPVYVHERLDSSNQTAKRLALAGAPHGTLVLAGQQSAGRGRMGRRFESPAGKGIYLSLVLRVPVPASKALGVTVGAAVAVARAVQKLCGIELGIKWVNDLYYQGKKVCGILTEAGTSVESGLLEWLVVGIGLNLTTTPADWPEELARTAGSLFPGGPAPVGRAALAGAIARELLALCPAFDCLDEYRSRCFVPGHWVTVCTAAETYAARAIAIDDNGAPPRGAGGWPPGRPAARRGEHKTNENRVKTQRYEFCLSEASYRCVCMLNFNGLALSGASRQLILPLSRCDISLRPEGVFRRESFPIVYGM